MKNTKMATPTKVANEPAAFLTTALCRTRIMLSFQESKGVLE